MPLLSYGCATLTWLLSAQDSACSENHFVWDSSFDRCSSIGGFVAAWLTCSTSTPSPPTSNPFHPFVPNHPFSPCLTRPRFLHRHHRRFVLGLRASTPTSARSCFPSIKREREREKVTRSLPGCCRLVGLCRSCKTSRLLATAATYYSVHWHRGGHVYSASVAAGWMGECDLFLPMCWVPMTCADVNNHNTLNNVLLP